MLGGLLRTAIPRLAASFRTVPSAAAWLQVGASIAVAGALTVPYGLKTGFLQYTPVNDKATRYGGLLVTFFAPSLFEEALFRSLLLPHPLVDGTLAWKPFLRTALLPLAVFVAYHLVNPSKRSREVFWDPRFLVMASILGAACSVSYYVSGGSLLAATVTHWVPVYIWLFYLGGYAKVHG
eukprot:jgi/Botrbrau1/19564/Bobra.0035s0056.1